MKKEKIVEQLNRILEHELAGIVKYADEDTYVSEVEKNLRGL